MCKTNCLSNVRLGIIPLHGVIHLKVICIILTVSKVVLLWRRGLASTNVRQDRETTSCGHSNDTHGPVKAGIYRLDAIANFPRRTSLRGANLSQPNVLESGYLEDRDGEGTQYYL